MNILSQIYLGALKLHRALSTKKKLPFPVISVGNIAVGGRAKTPMVIAIVQELSREGFYVVVLTRGYGRELKKPIWLHTGDLSREIDYKDTGDEALEIFLKTKATILIGKNRYQNAMNFYHRFLLKKKKVVFVLDDGFQHWSLYRDLDIVLIKEEDLTKESLLPFGRLREGPKALERAHLVWKAGVDFEKKTLVPKVLVNKNEKCVAITTRVVNEEYRNALKASFKDIEFVELADHAGREEILSSLRKFTMGGHLFLGWKEIVKIVSARELQGRTHFEIDYNSHHWHLHLVDYSLSLPPAFQKASVHFLQPSPT
jgi:tetraacyldisaccharide 4'-kinase